MQESEGKLMIQLVMQISIKTDTNFIQNNVFDLEFTVPLSIGVITTTEFNTSKNYDTFIDQSQTGSQNCLILRKLLIYFFSFSLFC